MSLTLALNNALSGLNINRQALAVLSQNIANANTAGYSRKNVDQAAVYLGGHGSGVRLEDVSRKVDELLQRAVVRQNSAMGKADVANDYADRIQILMGTPGRKNSIDSFIGSFFNALQSLAETPESASLRVNALNSGVSLTRQVSELAGSLHDVRYQADQDIVQAVKTINKDLRDLGELNIIINNETTLGRSTTELLDRRDKLVRSISQYIDITTYTKENGQINVFAGSGASLVDENVYQLVYDGVNSADTFIAGATLSPLQVYRIGTDGKLAGQPVELVSGGVSGSTITSTITSGKLRGLLDVRDSTSPEILSALDNLAAVLRDQFNAVHNEGSAYPGANGYTGGRETSASDYSYWSGKVRIALLDQNGRPVASPYSDETSGIRPVTLDLSTLDDGRGAGQPSTQGIIDEINRYFGVPQNKASVGNLNNIRLASNVSALPGPAPSTFTFDLDLENISAANADFWVSSVRVLDDTGTDITSVTSTIPNVNLSSTNTYATTSGSSIVTVTAGAAHGFNNGDRIYLSDPGVVINGIPSTEFNGFFTISNVTNTTFTIDVTTIANATGAVNVASQTAKPKYDTIAAGEYRRTGGQGKISANLSGNSASAYYDLKLLVGVASGSNQPATAIVTYRVYNNQTGLLNDRYAASDVTGNGTLSIPRNADVLARAMLVDASGNELAKTNGSYSPDQSAFLRLEAGKSTYALAVDSLDSKQLGQPNNSPPVAASERSFSHWFEFNNFFKKNVLVATGDTTAGSAVGLAVESRLAADPNLISLGRLTQSRPPADPNLPPLYTYERNKGDNRTIQALARLNIANSSFAAAGALGASAQTFSAYAGAIVAVVAADANTATRDQENAKVLFDGFATRSDSISGVNLDEELANTIIYQNAYTASARIITVTSELFDTLIQTVR